MMGRPNGFWTSDEINNNSSQLCTPRTSCRHGRLGAKCVSDDDSAASAVGPRKPLIGPWTRWTAGRQFLIPTASVRRSILQYVGFYRLTQDQPLAAQLFNNVMEHRLRPLEDDKFIFNYGSRGFVPRIFRWIDTGDGYPMVSVSGRLAVWIAAKWHLGR